MHGLTGMWGNERGAMGDKAVEGELEPHHRGLTVLDQEVWWWLDKQSGSADEFWMGVRTWTKLCFREVGMAGYLGWTGQKENWGRETERGVMRVWTILMEVESKGNGYSQVFCYCGGRRSLEHSVIHLINCYWASSVCPASVLCPSEQNGQVLYNFGT